MKLIIEMPDEAYNKLIKEQHLPSGLDVEYFIIHGIPLEEIPNPCIECFQNCCVCELNGEKCECQKVYVVKESKE